MNSAKRTHQIVKRNIGILLMVAVFLFVGFVTYLFRVRQHPAFAAAIQAIHESEELSEVSGEIRRIGWMPVHDVSEENAEYWIKVFSSRGAEGNRKVWVYLEKDASDNWAVDHFSVTFVNEGGGNDLIIGISLIAGCLFLFSLTIAIVKYMGRVRFLNAETYREVQGIVVDVAARLEKSTLPGQSNLGELKTNFEERSAESSTMMYKPQLFFRTEDGEEVILKHNFSSNKKYEPGDKILVLYHADDPENAVLADFFWFWPQFWFIITVVCLVFTAGAAVLSVTI